MEFLKYIDVVAEGLRRDGKDTTMENYQYARRRLAGYLQSRGKRDVSTGKVDRKLINGFCDYLVAEGVGISTISSYLSIFRTTLNKASREGLTTVFDLFLFCFCACGMEFSDLCFLKKSDMANGVITYSRRKTGLEVKIRVLPKMLELMDRWPSKTMYVFPILQSVSKEKTMAEYKQALGVYNKRLKALSGMLGDDVQLSSVSPRESWAVAAFEGGDGTAHDDKDIGLCVGRCHHQFP